LITHSGEFCFAFDLAMASEQQPIPGRCLCGAVAFEVTPPARFCVHCHCTLCRRANGAAYVTWAGFPEAQFRMVKGEDALVRFQATSQATRTFCRTCGTQLFFQGERWPGEMHVARAALEDGADLVPAAHIYYSDKAPWLTVHDDLPRLGGESGVEPLEEG
jgi:hypothetical protein